MVRLVRSGLRAAAPIVALLCAAWAPAPHRSTRPADVLVQRATYDSTVLAAALPSVLSPPTVQPGSRLVSMIAEDIDADGDLDVVANDGSLDLIVWTNDGSGRLSRQHGREGAGLRADPAAPGLDDSPAASDSVVPPASGSFDINPRIVAFAPDHAPLSWTPSATALAPAFVSTRTPRGPPASLRLI